MYKCCDCGLLFEEPREWEEESEYWGSPCSESWSGCPDCRGGYEEVFECEFCGEYHTGDEIYGGLCEDCISKGADFNFCLEDGQDNPETVKINGFLMTFFTISEVENILKNIIIEQGLDKDCSHYVNEDLCRIGEELLKKEVK